MVDKRKKGVGSKRTRARADAVVPPLAIPPTAPQDVSPVLFAFPATVIGTLLPRWDDIPPAFKDYYRCPWNELAARWFANTSGMGSPFPGDVSFYAKPGIDPGKAWRHVEACMRSFEPKHEHKMAGVSWLIDCFFEKISIPSEKKEYTG